MFHGEQYCFMNKKIDFYKDLKPYVSCKDYMVSGESYQLGWNAQFDMLVTTPLPKDLSIYYKSEEYISHTDTNKTLFEKVYQGVRKYTLKRKLRLINSLQTSGKSLLDIGAGTADFLKICKDNDWSVEGVEPSNEARTIASKKGIQLNENLNEIRSQKFDVITLWHVLEHVADLETYIHKLNSLLKDNGRLIIAVPNYKSYDAKYYHSFWAAYDAPRHVWHFSKNSISTLFSLANLNVEKIRPMKFDAYYVALLSEKQKTGKMNPITAFRIGFLSNWKAIRSKEYSSLIYILKKG